MTVRTAPALLVLPLMLAACGTGGRAAAGPAPGTPGAAGAASASPSGAARSSRSPASAVVGGTARAGGTAAGGSTGGAVPAGAPSQPAAAAAVAAPAGGGSSRALAPGTYTYDSSGTVTAGTAHRSSGTSTLTASVPSGSAQTTVLKGQTGTTTTDQLLRGAGTYLTRLRLESPAFTTEFRPSPAALLVPEPADVGRRWSWTARSTDGRTTVTAASRVLRDETLTIGGRPVPCAVVQSTLALRGDVTYDGAQTTWYATRQHLPAKEHDTGRGTVSGFPFSVDVTDVLRSVTAS